MKQLIGRGLDGRLIEALKRRAARAGRAAEAGRRAILEQALQGETETFAAAAARLRARTPPQTTDSTDLSRRDRDRDHAGADDHWRAEAVDGVIEDVPRRSDRGGRRGT